MEDAVVAAVLAALSALDGSVVDHLLHAAPADVLPLLTTGAGRSSPRPGLPSRPGCWPPARSPIPTMRWPSPRRWPASGCRSCSTSETTLPIDDPVALRAAVAALGPPAPRPMILGPRSRLTPMATIVCIPGAGGRGPLTGSLVAEPLRAAGHEVLAVDLPVRGRQRRPRRLRPGRRRPRRLPAGDLVLVAQSMGGLTAPLVAERLPVDLIVLLTAMVLVPGENGGEWWGNTGHEAAVDAQGLEDTSEEAMFLHDVPAEVLAARRAAARPVGAALRRPVPAARAGPTSPPGSCSASDDRFFPPEWMRGVVRERLGIEPDEVPGGHCAYLSRPHELAAAIHRCWTELSA